VPAIILSVYILLTLPLGGHSLEDSYMEYIGMILLLTGFEINYFVIINGCHKGNFHILDVQPSFP